jgi:hypothetical protein
MEDGRLEVVVSLGDGPLGLSFCRNPFERWKPGLREWAVLEAVSGQAEEIGLEPGLLLAEVDGRDCRAMPFEEIIPLLRGAPRPLRLKFRTPLALPPLSEGEASSSAADSAKSDSAAVARWQRRKSLEQLGRSGGNPAAAATTAKPPPGAAGAHGGGGGTPGASVAGAATAAASAWLHNIAKGTPRVWANVFTGSSPSAAAAAQPPDGSPSLVRAVLGEGPLGLSFRRLRREEEEEEDEDEDEDEDEEEKYEEGEGEAAAASGGGGGGSEGEAAPRGKKKKKKKKKPGAGTGAGAGAGAGGGRVGVDGGALLLSRRSLGGEQMAVLEAVSGQAARAGLLPGLLLLSVNGQDCSFADFETMKQMLGAAARPVTLAFRRPPRSWLLLPTSPPSPPGEVAPPLRPPPYAPATPLPPGAVGGAGGAGAAAGGCRPPPSTPVVQQLFAAAASPAQLLLRQMKSAARGGLNMVPDAVLDSIAPERAPRSVEL